MNQSVIILQEILFYVGGVKLQETFEFKNIEGYDTLFLENLNIVLGFNKLSKKWFLKENNFNLKANTHAYVWIFKFDQLENIKNNELSELESNPVPLIAGFVISTGTFYLKVEEIE